MAQLRAAGRFAHRLHQLAVQRSAPECPAAAHPHLHLREVSPEAELDSMVLRRGAAALDSALRQRAAALDSAALRRVGSALTALAIALRPLAVRTVAALESALLQAVWALMALAIPLRPLAGRPVAELESAASLPVEEAFASRPLAASVPERARLSAEAVDRARRLAGPVV